VDETAKKTALRMIPYGIYVMTANAEGEIASATVNWVTQTSFKPPLIAVGVKAGSAIHDIARKSKRFALNMLGKGQQGVAFAFFKPAEIEDGKICGESYYTGATGAPLLDCAIACVECKVVGVAEHGDHHIFMGEVIAARVHREPGGRADEAILEMKELGPNVFYGG
jgi:flavin reductase (DIM6/NTAB) family NADH-FMN oxidoreductase RutF